MMKTIALLGVAAFALLAACEPTKPTVVSYDPKTDSADIYMDPANATPKNIERAFAIATAAKAASVGAAAGLQIGTNAVPAKDAATLFSNICLKRVDIAKLGLKQNPESKTWYDPNRNLSVQRDVRQKGECSFVFGSKDGDKNVVTAMLPTMSPDNGGIKPREILNFQPTGKMADQTMYRIVVLK